MLEICRKLFSQWNERQVKYCHWKSNEHLMEGLDGLTDLDIYVSPEHAEVAESLLSQCGYVKCLPQKGNRYPNVCEWLGFDDSTGSLVHVHLHYQIITGTKFCKEYVFPIGELIISSRIIDEHTGVYVVDPNVEIIILMCRIALKASNKKRIKPTSLDNKEIRYLRNIIQKETVLAYCKQLMGENGKVFYNNIMYGLMDEKCWYRVYVIADHWLKPYRKYSSIYVLIRHYYFYIRMGIIKIANKMGCYFIDKKTISNLRLSVCLLGQDGSGKSTVTSDLDKWFNWKLSARRVYMGSGEHNKSFSRRILIKGAKIRRGQQKQLTEGSEANRSHVTQRRGFWGRVTLYPLFYYQMDVARKAYKVVRASSRYVCKGGIALYDRFPQIQFEGYGDGPKVSYTAKGRGVDDFFIRMLAKRELYYLKKIQQYQPSIIFKLMLSPEESIRRKPYEDIVAVRQKHEITRNLLFDHSCVFTIDAAQDYNNELIQIKRIIWEKIRKELR